VSSIEDCIEARETMEAWRRESATHSPARRAARKAKAAVHSALFRFGLFANSRDVPNYWALFAVLGAMGLGILIGRAL
jgi:hypothetical protein